MPILNDIMDHDVLGPIFREGKEEGKQEGLREGLQKGELAILRRHSPNGSAHRPLGSINDLQSYRQPNWKTSRSASSTPKVSTNYLAAKKFDSTLPSSLAGYQPIFSSFVI